MTTPLSYKNIKITYVDEKSIGFDKTVLEIPEGVARTVYLSKFTEKYKNGKVTTENIKRGDIVNLCLNIGPKYINVLAYNIIGHEETHRYLAEIM